MQRLVYVTSVLHCLPLGRSEPDSAATGTVLRTGTGTLEAYAAAAGFASVEVLPSITTAFASTGSTTDRPAAWATAGWVGYALPRPITTPPTRRRTARWRPSNAPCPSPARASSMR